MRTTKWGIPTLIEAPDPEESAKLCRKLGFSFVELNMNLPEYQHIDVPLLRSVMDSYGVYFTIHLDENMDMCRRLYADSAGRDTLRKRAECSGA